MVTEREPKIEHDNLMISIESVEEKPLYLTGDKPLFKVVIENQSSNKRDGKIAIRWRLAEVHSLRVVLFNVKPHSSTEYDLPREWLYREGTALYELMIMPGATENYANTPDKEIVTNILAGAFGVHPLCSYYVQDKDLHEYEKNHRKSIKRYSLITIGLTGFIIFLTIMNVAIPIWTATPNIEFEIDPSLGHFESPNIYQTTIRNPEKPMDITFTVRLHNTGTASAYDVLVKLSNSPQPNNWYNFHEAFVFPPGIRSYRTDSSNAIVYILNPGDSMEIDFKVSLFAPDYDEICNSGETPMIHLKINYKGSAFPITRDYMVKMP